MHSVFAESCAAVLWWIRSDSVFTHNLSTADWIETSTTSGYGAVPDTTSSADWIEASTTSGYGAVPDTTSSADWIEASTTSGYGAVRDTTSSYESERGVN